MTNVLINCVYVSLVIYFGLKTLSTIGIANGEYQVIFSYCLRIGNRLVQKNILVLEVVLNVSILGINMRGAKAKTLL